MFKQDKDGHNAEKVYCLNRAINGCDLFYEIEMPKIWMVEHPVGTVIGRAKIGERFVFLQGCTVGSNRNSNDRSKFEYPVIGDNVIMYADSSIIGNCNVGNNVIFSAGSRIIDTDIQDNCIVIPGSDAYHPKVISKDKLYFDKIMCQIWKE